MPLVLRTKCIVVGEYINYIIYNIIIINPGESTVGKTALIKSVQSDGKHFTKNYIMV